jgi:hypothetical protein
MPLDAGVVLVYSLRKGKGDLGAFHAKATSTDGKQTLKKRCGLVIVARLSTVIGCSMPRAVIVEPVTSFVAAPGRDRTAAW